MQFCNSVSSAARASAARWLVRVAKYYKPRTLSRFAGVRKSPKIVPRRLPTAPTNSRPSALQSTYWTTKAMAGRAFIGSDHFDFKGRKAQVPSDQYLDTLDLPVENVDLVFAPNVPSPITRKHSVILKVDFSVDVKVSSLDGIHDYEFWTFGGDVPGPFLRARVGDILDLKLINRDPSGMLHNVDFHAVLGPGGGSAITTSAKDVTSHAMFRLTKPGLFLYHCSVDPVSIHISNGMFGMILVEPEEGLPPVDKEFYIMQSEFYTDDDPIDGTKTLPMSMTREQKENPTFVLFNGREGAVSCQVQTTDITRLFFGNAGPNLVSSFHIIGGILDKVYRDADLISPPARNLQTTVVPPGGTVVIEMETPVPGTLTLVDHAIGRVAKGCVGFLNVTGDLRPDLYYSVTSPSPCPSCTTHPATDPALVALQEQSKNRTKG